ncbi:RNA methyltransferase [Desulfobacula toluolica]|uniref:SpoU: tRNA/rRNA methyltransferase n=1 Tax=Desulfobacula toluolica (strain DSM 7467 / Tol2) TaxID=651182 RepID=K0NIM7_DESTT|nr:RNA methyltransferase [Desulfobacula toluolica]CCK78837.1 SpoU: tRNA/rRNA methyltransferase [Desulfobacula toluolica Tol2]
MDTFGFTKKKLLSIPLETRHKHMINWLSGFYQKLTTNRINRTSLDLFIRQYNQILDWTGMTPFIAPDTGTARLWIESISDRIQYHRSATGKTVRDHDLLKRVKTNDLSRAVNQIDLDCHVALDGLRSLFNVGSIFRTCEAAGFNSVILGNTPGKEHPGVRKTAMGAHEWIEQEKVEDLAQALIEKKAKGFQIIGVETIAGARPFHEVSWEKKTIVVFGNEEYGISSHVMAACDAFAYIPMFGKKNSINVANAVAVICFQMASTIP